MSDPGALGNRYGRSFWLGIGAGWMVMAYGVVGLVSGPFDLPAARVGAWVVGLAVAHDLVLAPLALGIGVALARVVRPPYRSTLTAVLVCSAIVVLYAWPFARGWGKTPLSPSRLPLDYTRGLIIVLAAVWSAGLAAILVRATSSRVRRRGSGRWRDR